MAVNRFVLNNISYHGAGAIGEIPGEITRRGFAKAFVCSDPDLVRFGVTGKVTAKLDEAGIPWELYDQIKPNPTIKNVQDGVAAFKASGADMIVAVGGGLLMVEVGVAALGALAFGWPNPAQMMLEVAAMALCAAWLLGCDGRMSLFVATFYEIALALWSFLAAAWLGVAFSDAAFLDGASAQAQAALWLVHGLALVLVLIFRSRTLPRWR